VLPDSTALVLDDAYRRVMDDWRNALVSNRKRQRIRCSLAKELGIARLDMREGRFEVRLMMKKMID
jgi:hypothetical protein